MLRLLLGKTGTGKTAALLERALTSAREGVRTILLVPEQFSFEAERMAFTSVHGAAALRLSVLSFSRLSENIFRIHGGLTGKRLTDTARVVLMRLAVGEMKDTLAVYGGQAGKPHFLSTMLETIEELKQAGTSPDILAEVAAGVEDEQLRLKLTDVSGIYGAYQALVDRSYADPLDDIAKGAKLAWEHAYFRDCRVFIDGFGFFSPPEREMIYAMMEQALDVTVSLCADGLDERPGVDIFHDQKATAHRLMRYAREHFVRIAVPERLTENARTTCPALRLVERLLSGEDFLSGEEEEVGEGRTEGLTLAEGETAYREVSFVAAEIARLVREEGLRYRDFAIICRKLDDYRILFRTVLEERGIPLFMDRKDQVFSKPLAAFVLAALEAACGSFPAEAVLKVARSPAMGLSQEGAARLENYAYIWSVGGEGWTTPFRENPAGLTGEGPADFSVEIEEIEGCRQRVITPLLRLREDLAGCDGRGFSAAVFRFVEAAGVLKNMTAFFQGQGGGNRAQLRENDRVWNSLVDVLDLFSETLGGYKQAPREFLALFELALGQTKLGNIPATNDQVVTGSAESVRLASPKVVFVVGVNEGVFPARVGPHGILSDPERSLLIHRGVELASPLFQRAVQERFYLYSALCSPREKLYVSYTALDHKGAAAQPSQVILQIIEKTGASVVRIAELSPYDFVSDLGSARSEYARLAQSGSGEGATLGALLGAKGESLFLESVARAARNAPMEDISPNLAKDLLGSRVVLSPSRIETYYQCPFRFFGNYMLGLSPRRRVAYTPLESGNAIHFVLEMLLRELGGKGIGTLDDRALKERIDFYLGEYIRGLALDMENLAARFRYQFARLSNLLFVILRHIGNEFDQSMFTPAGMEVTVGRDGDVRPGVLRLDDGTVVELVGKVDRVDVYEDDTGKYVRVIDYKSGGKTFRLEDVAFGLNMQMLIYLFAICDDTAEHFGKVEPAGILYMQGNLSAVKTVAGEEDPGQIQSELGRKLQMSGVVLDDEGIVRAMEREEEGRYIPVKRKADQSYTAASKVQSREGFLELRRQVYSHVEAMARDVLAGKTAPLPAKNRQDIPCDYCDYHHLCGNCGGEVFRDVSGGRTEEGGEEDG